jgi:MoxR-like ATPase
LWDLVVNCYQLREALCLQSIPGLGKTEGARWFAWLTQLPFVGFNFNNDSLVEDLVGSPQIADGRTFFELGRIPKAFGWNAVVLYDELNAAPHAARQLLRPVFAKGTEMIVDSASPAITVKRGAFNYQVVAQNPAHDVRNSGVEELASAEFDRLTVVNVDLPPDPVERHIISMRCENDGFMISETQLDKLMAIATDIREASKQGSIPFTWGIRQQIKVARKLPFYPLVEAYKRAALDFYEEQSVQLVLDAIASY